MSDAAEGGAHGFADGDDRLAPRGGGIVADVQLDAVGDGDAVPDPFGLRRGGDGVGAGGERGRERGGGAPLERVAAQPGELRLDLLERLSFALADLDEEQLEQMAVAVGGGGAGAVRPVEQTARDVEAHGARARLGARDGVRGAHRRRFDERGGVGGEPAGVPGCVARVRAQQRDR